MATTADSTIPTFAKKVRRDRVTKNYGAIVNGQVIGYRDTYQQVQSLCNEFMYESLRRVSHADISDLTPEDAETALEVVTTLVDEEAAAPADVAEIVTVEVNDQQVIEKESCRVGDKETRAVPVFSSIGMNGVLIRTPQPAATNPPTNYEPYSNLCEFDPASIQKRLPLSQPTNSSQPSRAV